jgi:hypothetical protein
MQCFLPSVVDAIRPDAAVRGALDAINRDNWECHDQP